MRRVLATFVLALAGLAVSLATAQSTQTPAPAPAGQAQPPVGNVKQSLVVPQAPGSDGARVEPPQPGKGMEVIGAQRPQRRVQRRGGGCVALGVPRLVAG